MYCTKCGKENKDDVRFCSYCGAQISMPTNGNVVSEKEVEEKNEKKLQMKRGKKAEYIQFYDLILTVIIVAYTVAGGMIGYFMGGMYNSFSISGGGELFVVVGLAMGAAAGFANVIVAKILISVAENVHSITNNIVVLGEEKKEESEEK